MSCRLNRSKVLFLNDNLCFEQGQCLTFARTQCPLFRACASSSLSRRTLSFLAGAASCCFEHRLCLVCEQEQCLCFEQGQLLAVEHEQCPAFAPSYVLFLNKNVAFILSRKNIWILHAICLNNKILFLSTSGMSVLAEHTNPTIGH